MVEATGRELKDIFFAHLRTYEGKEKMITEENKKSKTYRLVLFYAVECGLKAYIIEYERKINLRFSSTMDFKDHRIWNYLKKSGSNGHDIEYMVRNIQGLGKFRIPQLVCNKQQVNSKEFNQIWRYGIQVDDFQKEKEIENVMYSIARWIESNIGRK